MTILTTYRVKEANGLVSTARPAPVQEQCGNHRARATAASETVHHDHVVLIFAQPTEHLFHDLHHQRDWWGTDALARVLV